MSLPIGVLFWLHQATWCESLQCTTISGNTAVYNAGPVIVFVFSVCILREKVTKLKVRLLCVFNCQYFDVLSVVTEFCTRNLPAGDNSSDVFHISARGRMPFQRTPRELGTTHSRLARHTALSSHPCSLCAFYERKSRTRRCTCCVSDMPLLVSYLAVFVGGSFKTSLLVRAMIDSVSYIATRSRFWKALLFLCLQNFKALKVASSSNVVSLAILYEALQFPHHEELQCYQGSRRAPFLVRDRIVSMFN